MAIFLHLVGLEIYLRLTPAEQERLRRVIYDKQLKAGLKNPGSAGLTVDRWDAEKKWKAGLKHCRCSNDIFSI
jgi:hypothetical protein